MQAQGSQLKVFLDGNIPESEGEIERTDCREKLRDVTRIQLATPYTEGRADGNLLAGRVEVPIEGGGAIKGGKYRETQVASPFVRFQWGVAPDLVQKGSGNMRLAELASMAQHTKPSLSRDLQVTISKEIRGTKVAAGYRPDQLHERRFQAVACRRSDNWCFLSYPFAIMAEGGEWAIKHLRCEEVTRHGEVRDLDSDGSEIGYGMGLTAMKGMAILTTKLDTGEMEVRDVNADWMYCLHAGWRWYLNHELGGAKAANKSSLRIANGIAKATHVITDRVPTMVKTSRLGEIRGGALFFLCTQAAVFEDSPVTKEGMVTITDAQRVIHKYMRFGVLGEYDCLEIMMAVDTDEDDSMTTCKRTHEQPNRDEWVRKPGWLAMQRGYASEMADEAEGKRLRKSHEKMPFFIGATRGHSRLMASLIQEDTLEFLACERLDQHMRKGKRFYIEMRGETLHNTSGAELGQEAEIAATVGIFLGDQTWVGFSTASNSVAKRRERNFGEYNKNSYFEGGVMRYLKEQGKRTKVVAGEKVYPTIVKAMGPYNYKTAGVRFEDKSLGASVTQAMRFFPAEYTLDIVDKEGENHTKGLVQIKQHYMLGGSAWATGGIRLNTHQ